MQLNPQSAVLTMSKPVDVEKLYQWDHSQKPQEPLNFTGFFKYSKKKFMLKQSAGILLYRIKNKKPEIFLIHPGGPFWKNKDAGVWSIPKGEFADNEIALDAAIREFEEETGTKLSGNFIELSSVKLKSGKIVYAWALQGDIDASAIMCNTFSMEWPPKSGKFQSFPEADRGEWFSIEESKQKINPSQIPLIDELIKKIKE